MAENMFAILPTFWTFSLLLEGNLLGRLQKEDRKQQVLHFHRTYCKSRCRIRDFLQTSNYKIKEAQKARRVEKPSTDIRSFSR